MKRWIDENGIKRSDPDCTDEWLFEIWAIGCDYDGRQSAEELKQLVGELVEMAQSARECLRQGKLFGVYGGDVPDKDVGKWIPVKDGLPEKTGRYLTTNKRADDEIRVFDLWFDCGEWYIDEDDDEFVYKVTHWMPLPQSPKGE